jgi:hypothetical protein
MVSKKINTYFFSYLLISVLFSALFVYGQAKPKLNIVIVPFQPKLYMGLYDAPINKATKWDAKKIKFFFRKNINASFTEALKSNYNCIDLCSDTVKYKLDINYVYGNSGTELVKLNTTEKATVKQTNTNKNIKKGRLVNTSVNLDLYYTHTKPTSKEVFKAFEKRFKSQYYITINQFDMVPDDMNEVIKNENSTMRELKIHYSVFNQEGQHIFGDYAAILCPKTENNPETILSLYLKPLIKSMAEDVVKIINTKK